MNKTVVKGSISDIMNQEGKPLAQVFAHAMTVVICDTSGSMAVRDPGTGESRYQVLLHELKRLQGERPGQVIVCTFSSQVEWTLGGVPPFMQGQTDMAKALEFTKMADVVGRTFFLLSDGEPDPGTEERTLGIASQYVCKINTIRIGPCVRQAEGKIANESAMRSTTFLQQISDVSGGAHSAIANVGDLLKTMRPLLPSGKG